MSIVWYNNLITVNDKEYVINGTFDDGVISIEINGKRFFEKIINSWAHQEILMDDVKGKYCGKIKKLENKIPEFIKIGKL